MINSKISDAPEGAKVGILVTCLVDLLRPTVGFATAQLLDQAGYEVEVPAQGCCGQPNFNGGDLSGSRSMAREIVNAFSDFDYVVVPSGSCAAMLKVHYPTLFEEGSAEHNSALRLAARTWELSAFLHDVAKVERLQAAFGGRIAVHDACSALRDLGIRDQPRALATLVQGCTQESLQNPDVCCGFGGLFCVKYPDISDRMAQKKLADLVTTAQPIDALVSTDLGCLLHLAGKLRRDGVELEVLHLAELLVREAPGVGADSGRDESARES